MKQTFYYQTEVIHLSQLESNHCNQNFSDSFVLVGLRLEDLRTTQGAERIGFEKIDEMTYLKMHSVVIMDMRKLVTSMQNLFIGSYIFFIDDKDVIPQIAAEKDKSKYVKSTMIEPINMSKNKKKSVVMRTKDNFFSKVECLAMLNSMDKEILLLRRHHNE